jgi:hypothetical protein
MIIKWLNTCAQVHLEHASSTFMTYVKDSCALKSIKGGEKREQKKQKEKAEDQAEEHCLLCVNKAEHATLCVSCLEIPYNSLRKNGLVKYCYYIYKKRSKNTKVNKAMYFLN